MQNSFARTDLAREASLRVGDKLEGLVTEELIISNCRASRVSVTDKAASDAIGKPMGEYYTLEMADYVKRQENSFSDCSHALSELLNKLPFINSANSVLIA